MARTPPSASEMPEPDADVVLLLEACAARLGDQVLALVRAEVGDDIRYRDGYVFQHLIDGPRTASELARRLGVSQQAASKQVADLVARALVTKQRDPADGRAWLVALSDRGRLAVDAGRRARSGIADDLAAGLGRPAAQTLVASLAGLSDQIGAMDHLLSRQLRPEDGR